MKQFGLRVLRENRSFILFILLMSVFRSAVADWYTVPSGSMQPTIVEGDRIVVDKMAYDLRIPFTHQAITKLDDPAPGDIIVFDSKVADIRLVKRVIGIPGDTVELRNNLLFINDAPVNYLVLSSTGQSLDKLEKLGETEHAIRVSKSPSVMSSFRPITVPEGQYLVMGDNRDNSSDSRRIGFVPRNEILGKTDKVAMSFDYDNYYMPRKERFLKALL